MLFSLFETQKDPIQKNLNYIGQLAFFLLIFSVLLLSTSYIAQNKKVYQATYAQQLTPSQEEDSIFDSNNFPEVKTSILNCGNCRSQNLETLCFDKTSKTSYCTNRDLTNNINLSCVS